MNREEVTVCILCGLAAGLIGYGYHGTMNAMCLGAGIGLLAPIALQLIMALITSK